MFVNERIDKWSGNTVLGIAITLYENAFLDGRYGQKKKSMYKERLVKWIRKHNIPLEFIIEKVGR